MSWTTYFQISFDKENIRNFFRVVYWIKTSFNQCKLNVDGSFFEAGAGFGVIVRSFHGDMVFGFTGKVHNDNVIIAKASALLFSIQNVWIETDSFIMVNLIKSNFCNNASDYMFDLQPLSLCSCFHGVSLAGLVSYVVLALLYYRVPTVGRVYAISPVVFLLLIYMSVQLNMGLHSLCHGGGTPDGFYAFLDTYFDVLNVILSFGLLLDLASCRPISSFNIPSMSSISSLIMWDVYPK
ncbi:hypothetical protein M5K25_000487 [Dendrobium thyrsiflorum]|uniref:RNase H type-1 domain-containing protein n=1 Tax=Dendrobium thyrsiflorum TaxID=117978 RepID=A0ABD0W7I0_DENTH